MEQRNLGRSGLDRLGGRAGLQQFRRPHRPRRDAEVVHKALDLGITFFDTSDTYGERAAARRNFSASPRRSPQGHRARHQIRPADGRGRPAPGRLAALHHGRGRGQPQAAQNRLDRSLPAAQPDPLTPIEETLRALDDLVQQGKVRYIGCSTLSAWQVVEAQWTSTHLGLEQFIACQERYSLLARDLDRELMPVIESYGLGLIPFSPLADGLLTGKYRRGAPLPAGTPPRARRRERPSAT